MTERYEETSESQGRRISERYRRAKSFLDVMADKAEAQRLADWALTEDITLETYSGYANTMRRKLSGMLSFPPPGTPVEPVLSVQEIGRDEDGTFFRVSMPLFEEGFEAYGLLIRPRTPTRCLAVAIHGGGGTPELAAGVLEKSNYNDMGRQFARRGHTVWMPACFERSGWYDDPDPEQVHDVLEMKCRLTGATLSALDAYSIITSTQAVLVNEYSATSPVVVAGLSYGGFRTLVVMALSEMFSAGISSCYFNNRRNILDTYIPKRTFFDWCFDDALRTVTDVELCRLICPRPLCIEVGIKDEMFPVNGALETYPEVSALYETLGVAERFVFDAFDGDHEFSGLRGFDFLETMGF